MFNNSHIYKMIVDFFFIPYIYRATSIKKKKKYKVCVGLLIHIYICGR